ncbi:fimbria/pilus outer membrane usher protein, partial [Salmonella enterica subsp. enterica serovar Anatum]|nr:fimbria/pilus outer membrane usher protein [Salmonella enterica subsp. enterica serovar Anatum]
FRRYGAYQAHELGGHCCGSRGEGRCTIRAAGNHIAVTGVHAAQGTYQYGVNNLLTLYGGTMLASDYRSFTLGTGWNTLIGAVSV